MKELQTKKKDLFERYKEIMEEIKKMQEQKNHIENYYRGEIGLLNTKIEKLEVYTKNLEGEQSELTNELQALMVSQLSLSCFINVYRTLRKLN